MSAIDTGMKKSKFASIREAFEKCSVNNEIDYENIELEKNTEKKEVKKHRHSKKRKKHKKHKTNDSD